MHAQKMFCTNCKSLQIKTEYIRWDPLKQAVIKFKGCSRCSETKEWVTTKAGQKMMEAEL